MSDEKTEPATDHKREEARKRGQVMKSQDLIIAMLLFAVAYSINFVGQNTYRWTYGFFVETYEQLYLYTDYDLYGVLGILLKALLIILICSAPMAGVAFIVAWIANLLQVGVLITLKPLNPAEGFKKMNPISGIKNMFSVKKIVEMIKSFIKMGIIAWVIFGVVKDALGPILNSGAMSIPAAISLAGGLALAIAQKVALAMVAIAVLDFFFQKWQFEKSLRMSKQEVKEEYKKLEGDPLVKSRQRQKQMEMAMNAGRGAVPNADVVITNPTHYAVALEYKPKRGMKAPVVIAKGKNAYALEIKRIAEEHFILIVEDPPTARMLYQQVKVDTEIPPELFQVVAKIIALLYKGRRRQLPVKPEGTEESAAPPLISDVKPAWMEELSPSEDPTSSGNP